MTASYRRGALKGLPPPAGGVERAIVAIVDGARRAAIFVVAVAIILAVVIAVWVLPHIRVNTDTEDVLARDLPFRQANIAYRQIFPELRAPVVVVIDGPGDRVEDGAQALALRMAAAPTVFGAVLYPPGEPFFRRNGMLYLSLDALGTLSDRLAESQAFLATLAAAPSLRGLFDLLARALAEGGEDLGRTNAFASGLAAVAATVEARNDGAPAALSWSEMLGGPMTRRVVVAETLADRASLQPGERALGFIRAAAAELGLTAANGVSLRLTGEVALETEELDSVFEGAIEASLLSLVFVAILVVVGLRSPRLVISVLATLVIGLIYTAGFAALAIGSLNLISVAFAVLFVGIAVDFGIHFGLRAREQELQGREHAAALAAAAAGVGPSLLLAGVAAMIAFGSFLPTAYRGVAELGVISAFGMVVAVATNLTVLPALLTLLPRGRARGAGRIPNAGAVEAVIRRHARVVVIGAALVGLVSLAAVAGVRFEKNPLNLQDPTREAVATWRALMREDPTYRPSISVVAPGLDAAREIAEHAARLDTVQATVTAADLVPDQQERKLEVIAEIAQFLAPLLAEGEPQAPPDLAEQQAAIDRFIAAAANPVPALRAPIERLARALTRFRATGGATADGITALEGDLLAGLPRRLAALREALEASPVDLAAIPAAIRRQYLAPDGRARVEILPRGDLTDDRELRRFVAQVTAAFPTAVGPPITLVGSGNAIADAFRDASILALVLIAILLLAYLRSVIDAVLVLTPLALAGLITFAISATIGPNLNFANVIVLPLLLGLGVSSGIYLVTRAREEKDGLLLRTITPRAVLFSALTTIASFGSLAISPHRGTASMGWLLLIAISLALICTLVVLPALLTLRHGVKPRPLDEPW